MNFMETQRERLILENPADPRIIRRETPSNKVRKGIPWNRTVADLRDPKFATVAMVCAIGLLVTAVLLVALPNFEKIAQLLQQFL